MKDPFDYLKMHSMLSREQERTRLSSVAGDLLAEKKLGLNSVAGDLLAEKKLGLNRVAGDLLAEKMLGLNSVAGDLLAEKMLGLNSVAGDLLAEKKLGLNRVAGDLLAEKTLGLNSVAGDLLAQKTLGISGNVTSLLGVNNLAASVPLSDAIAATSLANKSLAQMIQIEYGAFDRNLLSGTFHDWYQAIGSTRNDMLATAFKSPLINIGVLSCQAEIALNTLLPDRLGAALPISEQVKRGLTTTIVDFSHSYQKLWQSLESSPVSPSLSSTLLRLPAVEYYNGAILATRLTSEDEDEEDRNTQDEITLETQEVLTQFLAQLNPKLIAMRDGAHQAVTSKNPDRVRHFSASLRELFTHVMHELAPDNGIKDWSDSEKHYHNGRPTRRARLQYICRRINQQPLETFVEKDIEAVLEFLNLFQQGTHAVDVDYTAAQLRALEIRMDGALRFLFEISQSE